MFHARSTLAALAAFALLVAGCGGHVHQPRVQSTQAAQAPAHARALARATTAAVATACPPGRSYMGCSVTGPAGLAPRALRLPPAGPLVPDVSEFQGAVNWSAVKAWQQAHRWNPAGIFKLGEFRLDHEVAHNAGDTARLGFWRAGYWFVRNTGCSSESRQILAAARQFGVRVLVLDIEVPEARGYAFCLAPPLKAAGLTVVEYTAPGTNPDGSNPGLDEWLASYGANHVPCLFTCSVGQLGHQTIVAWQFTDGVFSPTVFIPGIGRDDVSVDFGITRLGGGITHPVVKPKPKPDPLAIFIHSRFPSPWGNLDEHLTVARFKGAYAHRAKYRSYLHGLLAAELGWLAARDANVATHVYHSWKPFHIGSRRAWLSNNYASKARTA